MTQAVLVGGLFIGVLSALPIVNIANCCCLWIVTGGAIAAYLAQQDDPQPLGPLTGARIGFRAGVAGAVIWLVASIVIDAMVAPLQQRAADMMLRNATDMPPEVRTWVESMGNRASVPLRFVLGFLFQLLIASPFAAVGGLLGAVIASPPSPAHLEP